MAPASCRATERSRSSATWSCVRSTSSRWARPTTTSLRTSPSCTAPSRSTRCARWSAGSSATAPTKASLPCAARPPLPRKETTRMAQLIEATENVKVDAKDPMSLLGIDHVEFWVGNAKQAAYYYMHAFGFKQVAYAGLETGKRDRASFVLQQGRIRIVLTGGLDSSSPMGAHQHKHGDGVKVIAVAVPDVDHAWQHAIEHGAKGLEEPHDLTDDHGTVRVATIATYGETLHTFVDRSKYKGAFLPGYAPREVAADSEMLFGIDHIVGNVEHMEDWVDYYERVFGMREMIHFSDQDISTEYSALMSKVVADGRGVVKFTISDP